MAIWHHRLPAVRRTMTTVALSGRKFRLPNLGDCRNHQDADSIRGDARTKITPVPGKSLRGLSAPVTASPRGRRRGVWRQVVTGTCLHDPLTGTDALIWEENWDSDRDRHGYGEVRHNTYAAVTAMEIVLGAVCLLLATRVRKLVPRRLLHLAVRHSVF